MKAKQAGAARAGLKAHLHNHGPQHIGEPFSTALFLPFRLEDRHVVMDRGRLESVYVRQHKHVAIESKRFTVWVGEVGGWVIWECPRPKASSRPRFAPCKDKRTPQNMFARA